ncbi:MAG: anion permease [Candidatus Thermoplasmatota archaeon]|jgi:PiT family inorganic phosphate transporter|nr:anion permease [Candidatus Thermoplasmatota archaeon]MCL5789820.1 anion permease [Candidatus Thermoplasmatota archaeon]
MQLFLVAVLLGGILTILVSGNNLSVSVGTLIGAKIVRRSTGILIGIIGYITGLIIEGDRLRYAATSLLPHSFYYVSMALLISIIAFILATVLRSPLSLTMVLVGTVIGISIHLGRIPEENLLLLIVIMWVASPIMSIAISYFFNKSMVKRNPRNIWKTATTLKWLLVGAAFFTSFTLGANTLGFILNLVGGGTLVTAVMVVGIVIGSIFFSEGAIRRVGEEMYSMRYSSAVVSLLGSAALVEAATILGIPLSNSQTLSASVVGSGLSYKFKAINFRPFLLIVETWVISTFIGLFLGYLV